MGLPRPAATCLGVGCTGLLLVVVNQLTAGISDPALIRAGVLAALLSVGLMLVAILWTRALPEVAARQELGGEEGLQLSEGLPESLRQELGWGSQMVLTATPAAVLLVHWRGRQLLRRGLLATTPFVPGAICRRAMERDQAISLVNLALYPGRAEFDSLLEGLPAVLVQPLATHGVIVVGGWSARCFSRSDLLWIEGWARRLTVGMAALDPC
ncbi:MAG: cofactor assembly of complex C subunit B [Cyanobium sp.]|nr:cofactor assembly of complex C subunit B [Cyanobium sp.]